MSNEIQKIQDEKEIVELQKDKLRALYDGGFIPKGCPPKEALARIITGAEYGLKPLQALNGIAIINGHPTLHSDSIPSVVMASGLVTGMHYKFTGEGEDLACTFYVRRKGVSEYQEWTYSMRDAVEAGVAGRDVWKAHKKKMLFNRARSWCFRNTFPDVLGNIYTNEEIEDMEFSKQNLKPTTPLDYLNDEDRYKAIDLEFEEDKPTNEDLLQQEKDLFEEEASEKVSD